MHRFCFPVTLIGLISLAPIVVHAAPARDARGSIQAAYNKRNAALAHFSIESYLAVDSANYHEMGRGHAKSLDKQRQAVIALLARAPKVSTQETVQSVTMIGKDALVTLRGSSTVVTTASPRHKPSRIKQRYAGRAFWISTPQGWRLKQERTLSGGSSVVR